MFQQETIVPRVAVPHKGKIINTIIAWIFALVRVKNDFPVSLKRPAVAEGI
jgi:hypothetical protein